MPSEGVHHPGRQGFGCHVAARHRRGAGQRGPADREGIPVFPR
jgi:hypothetical protein